MYMMNDIKEFFFFNILSILSDINTQLKIKKSKRILYCNQHESILMIMLKKLCEVFHSFSNGEKL